MKERLPLGLSVAALLLALAGLTPLGSAASSTLRRVAFAQRSDAVGGISAAREPHPGQLLALSQHRRFPASVIPKLSASRGPAGPAGPAGPKGSPGADGGQAIVVHGTAVTSIDSHDTTVARIDALPPGSWVFLASVELSSSAPASSTVVGCWLMRSLTTLGDTQATLGELPGATTKATAGLVGATQNPTPTDIQLYCRGSDDTGVGVGSVTLSALRVQDVRSYAVG